MNSPEYLNLGEVAEHFGWTARFVERLAVGEKLPGVLVAGQWRFRRDELVDWLDRKIQTLERDRMADLERKLEQDLVAEARPIRLADRLLPENVGLDIPARSRDEVLQALVDLAEKTGDVKSPSLLFASLVERETLCSTALPEGFAICHPRSPLPSVLRQSVFAFVRTTEPLSFGEEHGEATQLFFLVAATDHRAHLHALARLTRVLRGFTIDSLLRAETPDALIATIRRREQEMGIALISGRHVAEPG